MLAQKVPMLQKKKPRNYQEDAIKDVIEGFKTHDRGKLIMACGTGKTYTSLKIAEKSGCPIIPVAMKGTADIFENQFPKIRKRHVTVTFGEPIKIKELEKEQKKFLGAYTQSIIEEMLKNS